ncbi:M16 family metallopeptidase [Glaciecola petra]|uniref:Pitrilysin family protein n=1 Tax=Glaciecola petra TaxID=3075602 RepID=A0ABU2ZL45_9ALTE|nr:pitrilysin family protein [Aestuariibacter sp. P117]MDT0593341.1 pitrilysin family protein [Aestuariibacter sp. P117]
MTRPFLGKLLIVGAVALASSHVFANTEFEKVTEVEGISEYRLDNGLQVLLFPDNTKETVTVNVTYRVGSKHENYGETGMAHLLEHLVFKGTPKHPDIPAELSAAGARPNGTTWTDRTNYFETFAATEENINWALSMEASRMVDSFIAKEDLDSEMTVVRNEFESGENDPFRVSLQSMMAVAYDWHNYGKTTIGARSDLENVPIDRLKAFYKKYYQPDNATLIIAGKFEKDDMLALVDKYFAPIPKPTRVLPALYTEEPAKAGERSVTVRRVGDTKLVGSAYHIPAGSHSDFAALEVLAQVLGDTPSGRMHKALVEEQLASRVFGFNFQWQEPGLALFFAFIDKQADIEPTKKVMIETIENIKDAPVSADEVDRAKRNLLKNIELSFNSSERIALQLSEWLGMGDWRLYFLHRDRIEKVSVEDVQRVAEAYLVRNNRTVGQFIPSETPERVDIPKVASVADMLEGYTGREAIAQGELFEPSFDNIDGRTEIVEFKNGTKVSMLEKRTRGEAVRVSMLFRYGDEDSLTNKALVSSATGQMILRGAAGLSRQDIQDEFDKLKAQVNVSSGASFAFASVSTTNENLSAVMKLLDKILKSPSFDKEEFEQYKSTLKVDVEQNLQDPQRLAFNQYSRLQSPFPKGHPSYVETFEEYLVSLEALTLDDVKAFHKQFYGADNLEIGIVGDFDSKAIKSDIEGLFTTWESKADYKRIVDPFKEVAAQNIEFNTPDKENATFVAALMLPVGINHPDAPALELGNYILGGGFLNSRLATRLRQQDGLSYGAGSFLNQNAMNEKSTFGAYAICAPQNLNKVEKGFKEVMEIMLKDGFTDEEIESAKSGLLQAKKVSRAQDNELVGTLRRNLYLGRNMQWYKEYEAQMASLTADDVHKVMKKYFDLENVSIIKAGDMAKAEAAE